MLSAGGAELAPPAVIKTITTKDVLKKPVSLGSDLAICYASKGAQEEKLMVHNEDHRAFCP